MCVCGLSNIPQPDISCSVSFIIVRCGAPGGGERGALDALAGLELLSRAGRRCESEVWSFNFQQVGREKLEAETENQCAVMLLYFFYIDC